MYFSRLAPAVLIAIALTAFGSHRTTVTTSSGAESVTTTDNGKTTTIDTKAGAVTVGGDVSAANLGAPIYPGATKSDNGNISVSGANGTGSLVAFKTPDSFDQVYRFYKTQLPPSAEKMKVEDGSSSVASFQMADAKTGEQTTVMVEAKSGETTILITHGSASFGTSPSPAEGTTSE